MPLREEPVGAVHLSKALADQWVLDGTLDAEGGALVSKALELAGSDDHAVPLSQRRAEALVTVAACFLDNQHLRAAGRHRPHVSVIVEASEIDRGAHSKLADDQALLDPNTTSRLLCDCTIDRIIRQRDDEGRTAIVDVTAPTRVIPMGMWSALVLRDQHCRFPGCDRPTTWSEGHHVQWVSRGGPTRMDNLVLLCRRHHRMLHTRRGYEAKLEPDGTFHVTYPDGTERVTEPPIQPRARSA
jgi:hypothetical protein